MKEEHKVIAGALILGVLVGVVDSVIDYLFFNEDKSSFLDMLILDVPIFEIYIRVFVFVIILALCLITARFITERKQAEQALQKSAIYLDAMPNALIVATPDTKITQVNQVFYDLWGYAPEETFGRSVLELFPEEETPKHGKEIEIAIKTGRIRRFESVALTKKGERIPMSLDGRALRDEHGNVTAIIAVLTDITGRKEAEEALKKYTTELEEANRLKDMFTDILRHDLLNPIGVIGNIARIMEEEENLKDSAEIPVIKRNVRKLEEIVHNAADYAKLESAEKLKRAELDITELIEMVIDDFGPYIKEKKMNVKFKPGGEHKANASTIIESVFVNLLSNAIKYSPEGTDIKIAIEDSAKNWKVSFADQGVGILDEHKDAIFERLTRRDKSGVKGTGLGLAIVRRIAEMHNGRAWVEDNPGGGSIFYVEIPKGSNG